MITLVFLVWQVRLCVSTAVVFYCFVALIGLCASVIHDAKRPSAIVSLVLFFVLGWLYVILHFATHTVAFIKVFTGTEGRWQVTARSIKGTSPQSGFSSPATSLAAAASAAARTTACVSGVSSSQSHAGACLAGGGVGELTEPLLDTSTVRPV